MPTIPRSWATATLAFLLTVGAVARADYFSPYDFESGGPFPATPSVTINTSALTVDGGAWPFASVESQGPGLPDVAVFTFDGGLITPQVTLVGTRPAVILFKAATTIQGSWTVFCGRDAVGPGSGSDGQNGGGGGGGFGGMGGSGSSGGSGGLPYGDLLDGLEAGSGGGAVGPDPGFGGVGGGAVEIGALGRLVVSSGAIVANGGDGTTSSGNGSGGGSGGAIFLHGFDVGIVSSILSASGGSGGGGANGGGGGGGGRITWLNNTDGTPFTAGATIAVDIGLGMSGGGDGQPGVALFGFTDPDVGIPDNPLTLITGIVLEVDANTGEVQVLSSGSALAFGDSLGVAGLWSFKNGWGVADGDLTWFDDDPVPNQLLARLTAGGLNIADLGNADSVDSFMPLTLSGSPMLGFALADEYGEGVSAFSSLAFASLSHAFYFQGTVTVPEPTPGLLTAAVLLALGTLRRLQPRRVRPARL